MKNYRKIAGKDKSMKLWLPAAVVASSMWGLLSQNALATNTKNTVPVSHRLLLAEIQGWDMSVSMEPLFNRNTEPVALTVQLKVRKKPATSYANVVYQLFVQKENNWVPVYTSTGARLISNMAGEITLEPEVIPISAVRQAVGQNVDLNKVDIKASVQVRYDVQNGAKEQQIQLETLESFGSIAGKENTRQTSFSSPNVLQTRLQGANNRPLQLSEENRAGKGRFSLAVWQPPGTQNDVIARLSLKAKRGDGYLRERFIGDFRYKANARANFMKGLSAGDRIVVRLYDLESRPIGYSEFELPAEIIAVNLVLPEKPALSGVVRTVYGIDADADGKMERRLADYFTEMISPKNGGERVTFLSRLTNINISSYLVAELPPASANSVYPPAFSSGPFSVMNRTVGLYSAGLAPALRSEVGKIYQTINVAEKSDSMYYDVSQFMANFREKGVGEGIQVSFPDVPLTHWAKDYISELAAQEILQGFKDGNFRPNEPVTRAEFAAMIRRSFNLPKVRKAIVFKDVPANHWASAAIREAYEMGFFEGEMFNPEKKLNRLDAVVVLVQGLKFSPKNSPDTVLKVYSDSASIPAESRNAVAAATERGMVVKSANVSVFNASQMATRADVAAFLYQGIVSNGN